MIIELLEPVLVLVVGYLLRLAARYLKIELDTGAFNAILLGIVAFLLGLLGVKAGEQAVQALLG